MGLQRKYPHDHFRCLVTCDLFGVAHTSFPTAEHTYMLSGAKYVYACSVSLSTLAYRA